MIAYTDLPATTQQALDARTPGCFCRLDLVAYRTADEYGIRTEVYFAADEIPETLRDFSTRIIGRTRPVLKRMPRRYLKRIVDNFDATGTDSTLISRSRAILRKTGDEISGHIATTITPGVLRLVRVEPFVKRIEQRLAVALKEEGIACR